MIGRLREQDGQATVELALCLPILFLLVAALVEIGALVSDRARVWHAAREAARAATVERDPEAIAEAARRSGLDAVEVTVSPEPGERLHGRPVTVALTYDPPGRVPLVGALFDAVELHASATMRIETP